MSKCSRWNLSCNLSWKPRFYSALGTVRLLYLTSTYLWGEEIKGIRGSSCLGRSPTFAYFVAARWDLRASDVLKAERQFIDRRSLAPWDWLRLWQTSCIHFHLQIIMAALFWNQAKSWGQNTTSYKFQVPVITSGLYLLFKLLLFPSIFSYPTLSYVLALSSCLQGSCQVSHHCFYCWNHWEKEGVSEHWNVSAILCPYSHPTLLSEEPPSGSRLLVWVYYLSILTKY